MKVSYRWLFIQFFFIYLSQAKCNWDYFWNCLYNLYPPDHLALLLLNQLYVDYKNEVKKFNFVNQTVHFNLLGKFPCLVNWKLLNNASVLVEFRKANKLVSVISIYFRFILNKSSNLLLGSKCLSTIFILIIWMVKGIKVEGRPRVIFLNGV